MRAPRPPRQPRPRLCSVKIRLKKEQKTLARCVYEACNRRSAITDRRVRNGGWRVTQDRAQSARSPGPPREGGIGGTSRALGRNRAGDERERAEGERQGFLPTGQPEGAQGILDRLGRRMSQIVEVGRRVLAPFCSFGRWYNETAKRHPVATGVWTSGLKTSAADAFAQKVLEGREQMDWKRHATFCTFGFLYLGGFQYWLYNVKFTQWCGPITSRFGHKASAPIKTFIDQAIHHPLVYFPTFYAIKASVAGKPMSYAVDKYKSEIWTSVKTLWTVWVPLQLINFAFVPRHLRVPYVAGVSFGWTMILSVMQGKFDKAAEVADSKSLSDSVRETMPPVSSSANMPAPVVAQAKDL